MPLKPDVSVGMRARIDFLFSMWPQLPFYPEVSTIQDGGLEGHHIILAKARRDASYQISQELDRAHIFLDIARRYLISALVRSGDTLYQLRQCLKIYNIS